ncbi:MAG: hypothetical protein E7495_04855 [Ruminococcus flavefaciens]|jgi:hypothetical protein|nr:hypothetical protein [Ruminococcus flavefaciens]
MYYGKMTNELERLYDEYRKKWGCDPSGYENAEYGIDEYREYVSDIKKALKLGIELPDLYPHDDEF